MRYRGTNSDVSVRQLSDHPVGAPVVQGAVSHKIPVRRHWLGRPAEFVLLVAIVAGTAAFAGNKLANPGESPEKIRPVSANLDSWRPVTSIIKCYTKPGPDLTTKSSTFVDMEGTGCTLQTGPTKETITLTGKLIGRNAEGTGMSVILNVNGQDCPGSEALSYSRDFTTIHADCVYDVPANTKVTIKWRFLSPFGGPAVILRSSENLAPFIKGRTHAQLDEGTPGSKSAPSEDAKLEGHGA